MKTVLIIATISALASWLTFAVSYDRVRWWESNTGRNVMTLTVSLNALLVSLLIFLLTPYETWAIVFGTVALIGITVAGVWRTVEFFTTRRKVNHKKATMEEGSE